MKPQTTNPNGWHSEGVLTPPTKTDTHKIEIIKDGVVAELTAKQFTDLHERLTTYYNENYEELTKE